MDQLYMQRCLKYSEFSVYMQYLLYRYWYITQIYFLYYKRTLNITLHCSTAHCSTLHCSTAHYIALQHTAAHCSTLQHTTAHYSTLHYSTANYGTLQHTTLLYSTLQHTTLLYTTLHATTTHCVHYLNNRNASPFNSKQPTWKVKRHVQSSIADVPTAFQRETNNQTDVTALSK